MAVGCFSKSAIVFTLDMRISSRMTDLEDEVLLEVELEVMGLGRSYSPILRSGNLSGLASRSAFSRSRSTISIASVYLLCSIERAI